MVFWVTDPHKLTFIKVILRGKNVSGVLGLSIHIKLTFIIWNIAFISNIVINQNILLVINRPYISYYIALRFAYGFPCAGPVVARALGEVIASASEKTWESPANCSLQQQITYFIRRTTYSNKKFNIIYFNKWVIYTYLKYCLLY